MKKMFYVVAMCVISMSVALFCAAVLLSPALAGI